MAVGLSQLGELSYPYNQRVCSNSVVRWDILPANDHLNFNQMLLQCCFDSETVQT